MCPKLHILDSLYHFSSHLSKCSRLNLTKYGDRPLTLLFNANNLVLCISNPNLLPETSLWYQDLFEKLVPLNVNQAAIMLLSESFWQSILPCIHVQFVVLLLPVVCVHKHIITNFKLNEKWPPSPCTDKHAHATHRPACRDPTFLPLSSLAHPVH